MTADARCLAARQGTAAAPALACSCFSSRRARARAHGSLSALFGRKRARGRRPASDNVRQRRHSQLERPRSAGEIPALRRRQPLAGNPDNEIIVVDNGSERRQRRFPARNVSRGEACSRSTRNLGFGGGSNAGFRAAKNDIVVLLNSDMRVEPDFLAPLLDGFTDEKVFAVSCQIFFSDPDKLREETGLTQGWWEDGALRVRHRIDDGVTDLYPVLLRRRRLLRLRPPQSSSNSAASTNCSRRSIWKTPTSATWPGSAAGRCSISRAAWCITSIAAPSASDFPSGADPGGAQEEFHPVLLEEHSRVAAAGLAFLLHLCGRDAERDVRRRRRSAPISPGSWRAFLQLPRRAAIALARARPGRDRRHRSVPPAAWAATSAIVSPPLLERSRTTCSVLFVSPYPICPPIHGGGVFMYQTRCELARLCALHLVIVLDHRVANAGNHWSVEQAAASAEYHRRGWRESRSS